MGWFDRQVETSGSVLFRGKMPPRAEEFAHLEQQGIALRPGDKSEKVIWSLHMDHPQWGRATAVCFRGMPLPAKEMIDFVRSLTKEEKALAKQGQSMVVVAMEGSRKNVLRDRKSLLRFLRAVMGNDGLVALDNVSMNYWPRAALDEELAHDADVDVEALYCLHAVMPDTAQESADDTDDETRTPWLHSHGLAELGRFDFDILNPSPDITGRGADTLRALAYAILEESVQPNTPKYELAHPGGAVRFVDVATFNQKAGPQDVALRLDADSSHKEKRAVLCDPARGLLGRWFDRIKPSSFMSAANPDEMIVRFSNSASDLMAERARNTYDHFRRLREELAEFDFPVIAKIAYPVDGGGPNDKEHLWFTVHDLHDGRIDATLENEPFSIARMKAGQRGMHDLERLSDWTILTPLGHVNPRNARPARAILENRDEFRKLMDEMKRLANQP